MTSSSVVVVDFDPEWAESFRRIESRVSPLFPREVAIEHVGSTSVVGLAAKPIIDVGVIVPRRELVRDGIDRLATIGYRHRGDMGVPGREAFFAPDDLPRHHLYLYERGCLALRNHLELRAALREDPDLVRQYSELKRRLAAEHASDVEAYTEGKTEWIVAVLRERGFAPEELAEIDDANRSE